MVILEALDRSTWQSCVYVHCQLLDRTTLSVGDGKMEIVGTVSVTKDNVCEKHCHYQNHNKKLTLRQNHQHPSKCLHLRSLPMTIHPGRSHQQSLPRRRRCQMCSSEDLVAGSCCPRCRPQSSGNLCGAPASRSLLFHRSPSMRLPAIWSEEHVARWQWLSRTPNGPDWCHPPARSHTAPTSGISSSFLLRSQSPEFRRCSSLLGSGAWCCTFEEKQWIQVLSDGWDYHRKARLLAWHPRSSERFHSPIASRRCCLPTPWTGNKHSRLCASSSALRPWFEGPCPGRWLLPWAAQRN